MRRLGDLGVDGICTNDPRLFAELDRDGRARTRRRPDRAGHGGGPDRDGPRRDRDRQRLHGAERRPAGDRGGLQRRRRHRAVGHQRLLPGVRDGDRHRRAARRPVRAAPRLLRRQRPVRRLLAARRGRPGRAVADRRQGGHGARRRADLAGDPRDDLRGPAGVEGRAGRRVDPGRRGHRQRDGATARRGPDRRAELALDLLPERPDRGLRSPRHLAQGPSAATGGGGPADRLSGDGHAGDRAAADPARLRPGRGLGVR